MKHKERDERERGHAKISPRLGFARAALIEKLEDWGSGTAPLSDPSGLSPPTSQKKFNPAAPAFSPSPSNFAGPPAPANSMLSSASTSQFASQYPSPQQWGHSHSVPAPQQPRNSPASFLSSQPYSSPRSFNSGFAGGGNGTQASFPSPQPPVNTPDSGEHERGRRAFREDVVGGVADGVGGVQDGKRRESGSAGVRVGGRVIEFGDFPEGVRVDEARERAMLLRSWGEREREAEARRRGGGRAKGRTEEGVGLGIGGVGG